MYVCNYVCIDICTIGGKLDLIIPIVFLTNYFDLEILML